MMKICNHCGYRNFALQYRDKNVICLSCGKKIESPPLNNPMLGHEEYGQVDGTARKTGYLINPLKTPNE